MASEGPVNGEEEIRERHKRRVEEMRREKEKQMMRRRQIKKFAPPVIGAVAVLALSVGGVSLFHNFTGDEKNKADKANDKAIEGVYIDDTKGKNDTTKSTERDGGADGSSKEELSANPDATAFAVDKSVSTNSTDSDGGKEDTTGENKQFIPAKQRVNIFDNERMGIGSGPKEGYVAESLLEGAGKRKYKANESGDILQIGDTLRSGDEFYSKNAILIDLESNNIVAWKGAKERISPASMTKILTLLVAAEHVENLDDTFTITLDITDYSYRNQCSNAGFDKEEEVTVRDLLYGTILPSGADAAMGLAMYVAGSHEAFVDMMNEKLEELGLSETAHFTNCVGIYDENHYCTVYDMAMIIEAAADNALCREVLTAHTYVTSKTEQHPEGLELSNWFLRRIEDHLEGGEVLYAKTGYVDQSGNCAASYALSDMGKRYVCVTVGAESYWRCIFDHAGLYGQFFAS